VLVIARRFHAEQRDRSLVFLFSRSREGSWVEIDVSIGLMAGAKTRTLKYFRDIVTRVLKIKEEEFINRNCLRNVETAFSSRQGKTIKRQKR